ncbi:hypothetical protein [Agrococcus sp. ProA11]|uniref:hypothetical protein n=1 Tax=Agrococcus chionoecetis TaxID=3153752 RepID=UPI003260A6D0
MATFSQLPIALQVIAAFVAAQALVLLGWWIVRAVRSMIASAARSRAGRASVRAVADGGQSV